MAWPFDQAPEVACLTSRSVIDGRSVRHVTHFEDDHSWAFLDGQAWGAGQALLVAMKTVLERHPALSELADLPPGWSAFRDDAREPWTRSRDRAPANEP